MITEVSFIGALANRDFVKMNGLGNEIVIVDLRDTPKPIAPAEARAVARQEPYDQLMALYPARGDADAAIRIYNNDGFEAGACGNGMRCVAALLSGETGRSELKFETSAGVIACWRADGGLSPSTWAGPACAGTRFRWRAKLPTRGRSSSSSGRRTRRSCSHPPP